MPNIRRNGHRERGTGNGIGMEDKWMGLNTRAIIMYVKSLIYGTRMAKSTAA